MKIFFSLLFVLVFVFTKTVFAENLINLERNAWSFIADTVMGGVSKGKLDFKSINNERFYKMQGQVSTENNGGFIQFRTRFKKKLKKDFKGVRITVRGNGESYFVHIRTKDMWFPWQYYSSKFKTSSNWVTIDLPFSGFQSSNWYQSSEFSSLEIQSIGIVAFGKDFYADVDVKFLEFY
tara:strand:+ start:5712 stop:6248 length:537 start_codon:yes stop_codon:yes gene_type:complete